MKLKRLLKESQHLNYQRMNVGEEEEKGMTNEEKREFLKAVSEYKKFGESIYRSGNLAEVYESIKNIVETAHKVTLEETGDWFDKVTVNRHMKSMNESFKVFSNTIKEVNTLQQRLESCYDEMGEVLGKYYEIKEGNEFGAERAKAIAKGKDEFEVDGKKFPVTDVDAEDKENAKDFAKESVNEIQYKDAVAKFNDELIKHPMVKKAAQHYKKTPAEIVKVLQQRLSTKGNRGGDTKEVSIDFNDTDSGITIKHKMKFNESVNEGKHDAILDKLADIVKGAKSFMDIGSELKKNGIKYSFGTNMIPMYIIDKPVKIAILNNKYADGAERVVGTTAIGLMESIQESINESKYTVVNPKNGNVMGQGMKDQAAKLAKKMGGEKAGYYVIPVKNALKARRALEKFKFDVNNPKLKDIMSDLYFEEVEGNKSMKLTSIMEGYSTEEKRIVLMAVRKIMKYMNVDIKTAMNYVLGAGQELERDIEKGKVTK